jgi:hypothetical protein
MVIGGSAHETRLNPTFPTAKQAQHQISLATLTSVDPQYTG